MMSRRVPSRGFAAGIAIVLGAGVVAVVTGFLGVMRPHRRRRWSRSGRRPPCHAMTRSPPSRTNVQPVDVALSAQNLTRTMGGGSVAAVQLRAAHDGERLYILSEWPDDTQDAAVDTTTAFTDAAAVEFPAAGTSRLPSFCMGDPGAGVSIWQWKAAWQHDIDSGFATNRARYTAMQVDQYPQDGNPLFQTGLAAGNPLSARKHESPVENLVAAQFGTLTTTDLQDVDGVGRWKDGRWRVLFVRSLEGAEGARRSRRAAAR